MRHFRLAATLDRSRVTTEAKLGDMRLNGSAESGHRPRHFDQSGKQTLR